MSVSAALKYSSLWTIVKTLKLYILKQKITFLSLSTYNSSDCNYDTYKKVFEFNFKFWGLSPFGTKKVDLGQYEHQELYFFG